jgi:hypothetical protein
MNEPIYEEHLDDGSVIRRPGTLWANKTGRPVTLDLSECSYVSRVTGERVPPRERIYTIPPGGTLLLEAAADHAVHDERCVRCAGKRVSRHPQLVDRRTLAATCVDTSHSPHWQIVGGMGIGLSRLGLTPATQLHPAIDVTQARPVATATDDPDRDERLMARARRGVS